MTTLISQIPRDSKFCIYILMTPLISCIYLYLNFYINKTLVPKLPNQKPNETSKSVVKCSIPVFLFYWMFVSRSWPIPSYLRVVTVYWVHISSLTLLGCTYPTSIPSIPLQSIKRQYTQNTVYSILALNILKYHVGWVCWNNIHNNYLLHGSMYKSICLYINCINNVFQM